MKIYDYLVLGGGISGLSYAHFLNKSGYAVLLLEKSKSFGGIIDTVKKQEFLCETGPNTVVNRNEGVQQLLKDLKLEDQLIFPSKDISDRRYILFNKQLKAIPTSPLSVFTSTFFTACEKLQIIGEFFKKPQPPKEEISVKEFFTQRFGEGVYKKVVVPFLSGVFAGNPELQPMKYTLPHIYQSYLENGSVLKGLVKKKKGSANHRGSFFSLDGGLASLVEKIIEVNSDIFNAECEVESIERSNSTYITSFINKGARSTLSSRNVISCLPMHSLKRITKDGLPFQIKSTITYAPVVSLQFGFHQSQIKNLPPGFGILPTEGEKRSFLGVLFNSNFFPHQAPEDSVLITVIAGGMMHPDIGMMEEELLKHQILIELTEILRINGSPQLYHFSRWEKGIPQFGANHKDVLKELEKIESENDGFYIRGNFTHGPSVANCIDKALNFANTQKKTDR